VLSSSRIVGVVATGGSNSDSVDSSGMLCCETMTDSLSGESIRSVAAVPFDDGLFVKIGNNWSEFHSPSMFFLMVAARTRLLVNSPDTVVFDPSRFKDT
jgi:hypothetical protein